MPIFDHFSAKDREVLRKRAARAARPVDDQEIENARSVLIVAVGKESYAIPTEWISGVYEGVALAPVPCVPAFIAGVANIRGHLYTVLDLASFLNIADADSVAKSLVVIAHEDFHAAFAVAETGTTQTIAAASFAPVPDSGSLSPSGHLTGLLPDGTGLLDVEAILNEGVERIITATS